MLLSKVGWCLYSSGQYVEAEQMHQQTLELRRKVLGPEHPHTLASMSNFALVLNSQGKYDDAEEMHRRTLGLGERVLGNEHPDTLASLENLADLLRTQGKEGEAEEMYERVQTLRLDATNIRPNTLGREEEWEERTSECHIKPDISASNSDSDSEYAHSIFSSGSFASSLSQATSSGSIGKLLDDASQDIAEEFAYLFHGDSTLGPLFASALEKTKIARFRGTFPRLLQRFAIDLRREAQDSRETAAVAAAELLMGSIRFAVLREIVEIEMQHQQGHANHLTENLGRTSRLETALQQIPMIASKTPEAGTLVSHNDNDDSQNNHDNDDSDDSDDSDDNDDYGDGDEVSPVQHVNVTPVKGFILSSHAFARLQNNSKWLIHPNPMSLIRNEVYRGLTLLSEQNVEATFTLEWEFTRYVDEELYESQDLSQILTFTGSTAKAYAATCKQFLVQTWVKLGSGILDAIKAALKIPVHGMAL
jgi:tetratricopeptide (TPR) repeat protein